MTLSKRDRLNNIDLALRLMMDGLEEPYEWQEHDARSAKFAAVHRTTWQELDRCGMLKARTFDRYELTGPGWIAGLKATGRIQDPEFKKKVGCLAAAIKAKVKGRAGPGFADRAELARETGLSEFFIYDAIDSGLLCEIFGRIGATWALEDQMKNSIDIPPDFGEVILDP
jgi:hypothetical protein